MKYSLSARFVYLYDTTSPIEHAHFQSRFSDATLLAHHMATCHVALAHGDRSNGAVLLAAAADKASLVRYIHHLFSDD